MQQYSGSGAGSGLPSSGDDSGSSSGGMNLSDSFAHFNGNSPAPGPDIMPGPGETEVPF